MVKKYGKKMVVKTKCSLSCTSALGRAFSRRSALRDPAFLCLDLYREEALGVCVSTRGFFFAREEGKKWYQKTRRSILRTKKILFFLFREREKRTQTEKGKHHPPHKARHHHTTALFWTSARNDDDFDDTFDDFDDALVLWSQHATSRFGVSDRCACESVC